MLQYAATSYLEAMKKRQENHTRIHVSHTIQNLFLEEGKHYDIQINLSLS